MKKNIGKIITGVIAVVLVAVLVIEFVMWNNDKTYYEAQLNEYQTAVQSLTESVTGKSADIADANKSIVDFKNQIVQMQSDLEAYKKVVDEINAEREEKNKALEEQKKANEDEWNALSENQQKAITEAKERADMVSYLFKNNEEYANLYLYMRELSDKGLVDLKASEFKTYKANKTRMNDIEAEYKASLEKSEPTEQATIKDLGDKPRSSYFVHYELSIIYPSNFARRGVLGRLWLFYRLRT